MATGIMGRESIFRGKEKELRVQGLLTQDGSKAFERGREALRTLYASVMGREPSVVSDADTIEFLARGASDTRVYLRDLKRRGAA